MYGKQKKKKDGEQTKTYTLVERSNEANAKNILGRNNEIR